MGLLDMLPTSKFGLKGATPPQMPGANKTSTLHYQSSITGNPELAADKPAPSILDLDGKVPTITTAPGSTQKLPYINNAPR